MLIFNIGEIYLIFLTKNIRFGPMLVLVKVVDYSSIIFRARVYLILYLMVLTLIKYL